MEPFSMMKLFDFSVGTLAKVTGAFIKAALVLGTIAVLVWSIYVTIIKPHTNPTPNQKADVINNYNYKPLLGFGCMRMPIKDSVAKPKLPIPAKKGK